MHKSAEPLNTEIVVIFPLVKIQEEEVRGV